MKQLLITFAALVLVGCGPSVNIHKATKEGNIGAVKQHIAAGADVSAIDNDWTPLKYAAHEGHKEVVELLIAEGAGVNTKTDDGWNPLILAAIKGYKEIVELLIANGADVNTKNEDGETPLDWAINFKKPKSPTSSANTAARREKN